PAFGNCRTLRSGSLLVKHISCACEVEAVWTGSVCAHNDSPSTQCKRPAETIAAGAVARRKLLCLAPKAARLGEYVNCTHAVSRRHVGADRTHHGCVTLNRHRPPKLSERSCIVSLNLLRLSPRAARFSKDVGGALKIILIGRTDNKAVGILVEGERLAKGIAFSAVAGG